jgi:hypothetical protein
MWLSSVVLRHRCVRYVPVYVCSMLCVAHVGNHALSVGCMVPGELPSGGSFSENLHPVIQHSILCLCTAVCGCGAGEVA